MLLQEILVVYIVVLQELEGGSSARCHIRGVDTMRSVIRPAEANLLPIEGCASLLLLLGSAFQAYNLETALLFFGELEHTWSVRSR